MKRKSGYDDEEEHDPETCELCRTGRHIAIRKDSHIYKCLETDAALWGRTIEEQFDYVVACAYGVREPHPADKNLIDRLRELREQGKLPWPSNSHRPSMHHMTVGEAVRLYLEVHLAGRAAWRSTRQVARQHLSRWFERAIASLTRVELLTFKKELQSTPAQFNNAAKALKCAIRYVQREGYYEGHDPTTFLRRYECPARSRFCQPHEASPLMKAILEAPAQARAFFLLVGCTSSRPIEVCRMRWDQLGAWQIDDQHLHVWEKGLTKNGTPDYKPIPRQVWELLIQLPQESPWVFPGKNLARHWATCTYQKYWRELRLTAGVPDMWVYDLRRTVASWLSIHGENLQTVQHVLNHRSLQSTHVYARLNLQAVAGAIQRHTDRLFQFGSDEACRNPKPIPILPTSDEKPQKPSESEMEWPG